VKQMGAYSLHYYTLPSGSFEKPKKGPALTFNEADWIITLKYTLDIDEMVKKHSAIMDKYDPQKRIGLYVDEWGTWYDVEPGTNPGFLFQQNTMRDAVVAGLNLNVFQKHADRVRMTNIAQMINVLQAMVLTDKEKMLLTPTYHVFEMYKPFQNSTSLPSELTAPEYKLGDVSVPSVSASAARTANGTLVLSLVNTNPNKPARVTVKIQGATAKKISARVLTTDAMNAHNTFDSPEAVKPAAFNGGKLKGDSWVFDLPSKSVVVATLN
jgi:alpha-L-arabinofuranosidase